MGNKSVRIKVMLTLTGGGFLWEAKSLIKGLKGNYEYCFVTTNDSMIPLPGEIPEGTVYRVERMPGRQDGSVRRMVSQYLMSFFDTYKLLKKLDIQIIVCIGTPLAIPLCIWGKLYRHSTIFVESITRTSDISRTARLLLFLRLCDRVYVQWPELARSFKGTVYKGNVL
ncbi:MAG: hypothetical protein H6976_08590 [Gammaproteobacteria bacterium]|nr:hypothetical protein [Gammaproteobacteria bacterium]